MIKLETINENKCLKKNKKKKRDFIFKNIFRNLKKNKNDYIILRKPLSKQKNKNKKSRYIIFFIFILSFIFYLLYKIIYIKNEKNSLFEYDKISYNFSIEKDRFEEIDEAQKYMDLVFNHKKIDKDKIYYLSKNPKISIVLTVYNGEAFLKTSLLSIQNQDFKDIEIVIIDDGSIDNSVNLTKELMKTEPRIVLYENKENKGILYSKSKGILLSKGKYIMVLDVDDIYVQRDAFTSLYIEAEKNNLDILGFAIKFSTGKIKRRNSTSVNNKRIIYQPELSNLMYSYDSKGKIKRFGGNLANIFVKAKIYKKVVKLIDEKNLNTHMVSLDDFIIYFLLTRNAYNAEFINRFFYMVLLNWNPKEKKVKLRNKIKQQNKENKQCFSYLNFFEIFFKNTKNTYEDKKLAFSQVEFWYLKTHCRKNEATREKAKEVFKLYLNCEYISEKDKAKIQNFIVNN